MSGQHPPQVDVELVDVQVRSDSIPAPPADGPSRGNTIFGPPPSYPQSRSNTIGPPPDSPPPASRGNTIFGPPPTSPSVILRSGEHPNVRSNEFPSTRSGEFPPLFRSGEFPSARSDKVPQPKVANPIPRILARAGATNTTAAPAAATVTSTASPTTPVQPHRAVVGTSGEYHSAHAADNQTSNVLQSGEHPDPRISFGTMSIPGPPLNPPSRSGTIQVENMSRSHTVVGAPWWPAPRGLTIPGPPSGPPSRAGSWWDRAYGDRRLTDPTKPQSDTNETEEEYMARMHMEYLKANGRYCLCIPRKVRLLLLFLFLCGGVAMIYFGFNIVNMMRSAEKAHLEKTLPLSEAAMGSARWSNWQVERTAHNVFMYNLTNLYDVLTVGATPTYSEIGPLYFNRVSYRLDINTSVNGEVGWTDLTVFEVVGESTQQLLNESIVTINFNYLGGMAQVQRMLNVPANPPTNFHMPQPVAISDEKFHLYAIGTGVLPTINHEFLDPSSSLQNVMQLLLLPVYFQAAISSIAGTVGKTTSQIVNDWASGVQYDGSSNPSLAAWSGFSLPSTLSNPASQSSLLWSASNPLSLANGVWVKLSQQPSLAADFIDANQITEADFDLVSNWVAALTAASNKPYEMATCATLRSQLMQVNWIASATASDQVQYLPHSWSEVGALQFGTGLIGTILTGNANALSVGAATSMVDLIGPAAGLNAVNNVKEPMEFPSGAMFYNDPFNLLHANDANLRLMINTSTVLLSNFSTSNSPSDAMLLYSGLISALNSIVGNPLDTTVSFQQRFDFLVNSIPPSIPAIAMPLLNAILNPQASNAHALQAYFNRYIGLTFVGDPTTLDPTTGVAAQNGGLFTKNTIRDHVFGYTNKQGFHIGAILGLESDPNTFGDLIESVRNDPTRYFAQKTGESNLQELATYTRFMGYDQYQYGCEYHLTDGIAGCSTPLNTLANNYLIWGEPEVVVGSSDGVRIPPFHEIYPLDQVYLFVNEIKRVLPFVFTQWSEVSGIRTARYLLDETATNSTIIGAPYQNRWRNDATYRTSVGSGVPDGFINLSPLQGGVPLFASYPRLYMADPSERAKVNWPGNATADLHGSFLEIEPLTGISMQSAKRLQANIRVRSSDFSWGVDPSTNPQLTLQTSPGAYTGLFKHNDEIFLPYYYGEELSMVSDADATSFKSDIYAKRRLAVIAQYLLLVFGFIVAVVSAAMLAFALKPISAPTKQQ